jgi:hypothetical protein
MGAFRVETLAQESRRVHLTRPATVLIAALSFAPVFGFAAAQGGFFPTSWGWGSVALFWTAAVALAVRPAISVTGFELAFATALALLVAWTALSAVWSPAPAVSLEETERALAYLGCVAAVLIVGRTRIARQVLVGTLGAISLIAAFSLATRVLPDRIGIYDRTGAYRLAEPIGYWNGLALFTAMGALVALGFAARSRSTLARAVAAFDLVVLLATFYFTFGRAGWIALAAGLLAALAVDPRRLQLAAASLVVLPPAAAGMWLASRQGGLTHAGTPFHTAVHDGHRFALLLILLGLVNAALATTFALVEKRVRFGRGARVGFAVLLIGGAIASVLFVFVRYAGPVTLAERGYHAFKGPPPHISGNLNSRLLSFSGNGRADLWRLAWDEAGSHPFLGGGAGTYERYFLAHQPADVSRVKDAHGLYIETLAELGPVGLGLLVGLLAIPLAAVAVARRHRLVPTAVGAYVAYLVHAGVDWDWELPAVTVTALLCGAAILLLRRRYVEPRPLSHRLRWPLAGLATALALLGGIGVVGHLAISRSVAATHSGDWGAAANDARRARFWMPWSPQPWIALGNAQLGAGATGAAKSSFLKAISIDSGDWETWYALAKATSGRARLRALRRAAALYPQAGLIRQGASP